MVVGAGVVDRWGTLTEVCVCVGGGGDQEA